MGIKHAIQPEIVEFLVSPGADTALAWLAEADLGETNQLPLLDRLRRHYTAAQAGALLSLARLRHRAAVKFPAAERMFFTPDALEQATHHLVAEGHAAWLDRHAPAGTLLDLGCGIGGDLLALARFRHVIAYERDPVRAQLAMANVRAIGLEEQVEIRIADWVEELTCGGLPDAAGAFVDPSRRVAGRRVFSLNRMEPSLAALRQLQGQVPVFGAKVMPGVADDELPGDCGVEFISHARVCKEAVLWFGPAAWRRRWASIVSDAGIERFPADDVPPPTGEVAAGMTLYEPDPALIRAHCLGQLCERLQARLFDAQIAYLVGSQPVETDLAQSFHIAEVHPYSLKLLNRRLQALAIARVELKKRGFPVEPEQLRGRLRLAAQGRDGVVLFTRQGTRRLMLIGWRVGVSSGAGAHSL